jgi:hypothetical protein
MKAAKMRKRIAAIIYSLLAVTMAGACAPVILPEREAIVCDDKADPDCAPAREVEIEE